MPDHPGCEAAKDGSLPRFPASRRGDPAAYEASHGLRPGVYTAAACGARTEILALLRAELKERLK